MSDFVESKREKIKQEFQTAKELVEQILKTDQRARNQDMWLCLMVWQKLQHIKVFIPYNEISRMIPAETIRRCRQKLNEEGKWLPTDPAVAIHRKVREELIREYFGKSSPTYKEYINLKYKIKNAKI